MYMYFIACIYIMWAWDENLTCHWNLSNKQRVQSASISQHHSRKLLHLPSYVIYCYNRYPLDLRNVLPYLTCIIDVGTSHRELDWMIEVISRVMSLKCLTLTGGCSCLWDTTLLPCFCRGLFILKASATMY